jgi:subtilisin family serine protease
MFATLDRIDSTTKKFSAGFAQSISTWTPNFEGQVNITVAYRKEKADIINLSFSLGSGPKHGSPLVAELDALVRKGVLIFATASNAGENASRG